MPKGEDATSALAPIIQRLLPDLHGAAWIARRVEVLPGVVDSEIIHVTPAMDHLYGYTWPDTLVGQRISEIHLLAETQITRQYALLRYHGLEAPQHYVMHGVHPNGQLFRVIKHVQQQTMGPLLLWITHHEPWHRSAPYPGLRPLGCPPGLLADVRPLAGYANVAEAQAWLRGLHETAAPEGLCAALPAPALPPIFGTHLRQARQRQGWSLRVLAQRCTALGGRPVTRQHLSSLEQGRRRPSLHVFQILVTVLALDPTLLLATLGAVAGPGPACASGSRAPRPQERLAHVQAAAQQIAQAQQGYREALRAAQQAGHSLRQLAAAAGQSPSRIRQLLRPTPPAPAPPLATRSPG
jgi:transcriptional regulator with XRE-family HTH domain